MSALKAGGGRERASICICVSASLSRLRPLYPASPLEAALAQGL